MALSTADTNKWTSLLDRSKRRRTSEATPCDYERTGPIRQRQRRLSKIEVKELGKKYSEGATVYELAADFGMSRSTVSIHLKRSDIPLRLTSPTNEMVDEFVRLYHLGFSLAKVGQHLGFSPGTVQRYLRNRGITTRDTHGRDH